VEARNRLFGGKRGRINGYACNDKDTGPDRYILHGRSTEKENREAVTEVEAQCPFSEIMGVLYNRSRVLWHPLYY
jgi:hypothetical protein